jgi:UDP-N-acetylenolpyruvoylglucosamine reductase
MSTDLTIQKDFDLKKFNTMGLSSKASFFVEVDSVSDLKKAIEFAK